jgi:hypothetical protein
MKLLYSKGPAIDRDGPIHLVRMEGRWYVVGRGFIYAVDSKEEGRQLIEKLEGKKKQSTVRK